MSSGSLQILVAWPLSMSGLLTKALTIRWELWHQFGLIAQLVRALSGRAVSSVGIHHESSRGIHEAAAIIESLIRIHCRLAL